jgi:hypothetical protein
MTFAFSSIWLNAIANQILYGFFICFSTKTSETANIPVFSKTTCITVRFGLVNLSAQRRFLPALSTIQILSRVIWGADYFFPGTYFLRDSWYKMNYFWPDALQTCYPPYDDGWHICHKLHAGVISTFIYGQFRVGDGYLV